MSAEPILIGADVGTTNIKAVAFDRGGRTVARASSPTPTRYPRPGRAHHDAEELWASFARTLREVTDRLEDPRRVTGVAVASFAEAAVPLDSHGRPTHEVIAWFDGRSRPQAERLGRDLGGEPLFALTGLSLQPIFGLCKLLWLKENEPEAFARTTTWLNVADYMAFRLSGVPATDFSLASRTLALDLHGLEWAWGLLEDLDIPSGLFAPLRRGGSPLGPVTPEAAGQTGLPESARVAVGGHDHVCGALAAGVTEKGTMLNSLGTAEAIFLPLERPLTDPEVGRQGYTQGAHVAGQYYAFGGQYTSGASVEWFKDTLGGGADYDALIAEAERVPPGSLGAFFLPHLRLANPPYDDPRSRGAFVGLSTDVGRGALFRAVLEGLAFDSRNSLEPLLGHAGVEDLRAIYAIGGGAQNRLLMRIKATVFDRAITVLDVEEATSLGAAILGGIGAGVYADLPSALGELRYEETPVEPVSEEVQLYDDAFRRVYRRIYPALREVHHEIYGLGAER
ncbi:MAG: FGGY family carbohydrate kinase [Actinomycetota bacterium]|nr:FGGY family carbohydrate kinase [Actinomycetota bacterium]